MDHYSSPSPISKAYINYIRETELVGLCDWLRFNFRPLICRCQYQELPGTLFLTQLYVQVPLTHPSTTTWEPNCQTQPQQFNNHRMYVTPYMCHGLVYNPNHIVFLHNSRCPVPRLSISTQALLEWTPWWPLLQRATPPEQWIQTKHTCYPIKDDYRYLNIAMNLGKK